MAYNRNIPQPTDLMSNSQSQILGNFQIIDSGTTGTGTGFSRNHVTLTDGTNGGLHNRVDYFQALASPAIAGFVSSIYPRTVTNIELFYKNTVQDMQITDSALAASSGQGMLPGGLLVKCGSSSILNGNSIQLVTFGVPFPTAALSVVCCPNNTNTLIQSNLVLPASFTAERSGTVGNASLYWIAIGY